MDIDKNSMGGSADKLEDLSADEIASAYSGSKVSDNMSGQLP